MVSNRSLASLTDKSLLSHLFKLVAQEKQMTLSVLLHLAELDRRDLYLEYGFSSLFDYCVGALGYSRSAAGRRIASARCVYRYPKMFGLLESGEVNLTTVGLVASILTAENKDLLLKEIRGKTERQVESIVARYKPPIAYRDRVRPVRVAVPEKKQNGKDRRNPLIFNSRSGTAHRTNCGIVESPGHTVHESENRASTKIERRLLIQFLADEEFMAKLDEVKSLLSNKIPDATFEAVFEAVLDEFIDSHSPEARDKRREERRAKKIEKQRENEERAADQKQAKKSTVEHGVGTEERSGRIPGSKQNTPQKRSRHIPAKIRDAVYKRDSGKCTFVGNNGKRCSSIWRIEVDHIQPFARGGGNSAGNLRLLCGRHNRLAAEKVYGKGFMEGHYQRE